MQPGVPPPTSMYANQPQQVYASPQNPQHGQGVATHPHYFQGSGAGGMSLLSIFLFVFLGWEYDLNCSEVFYKIKGAVLCFTLCKVNPKIRCIVQFHMVSEKPEKTQRK